MSRSITVYVADEKLKKPANKIIEVTRGMTGDSSTQVNVEVFQLGGAGYTSNTGPTWTVNYPANVMLTGAATSGNITVANTSNLNGTTTTGMIPPSQSSFYVQTPSTNWNTHISNINVTPQPAMTPDQVPSSELFEQMLIASIKQLNEAYNLGRVHGYIEGKKNGSDEVRQEVGNALDCDPLTYAEAPSLDGTTSSPTV